MKAQIEWKLGEWHRRYEFERSQVYSRANPRPARLSGWCNRLCCAPTLPEPANGFDQEP